MIERRPLHDVFSGFHEAIPVANKNFVSVNWMHVASRASQPSLPCVSSDAGALQVIKDLNQSFSGGATHCDTSRPLDPFSGAVFRPWFSTAVSGKAWLGMHTVSQSGFVMMMMM